jgi:hypothetical protein
LQRLIRIPTIFVAGHPSIAHEDLTVRLAGESREGATKPERHDPEAARSIVCNLQMACSAKLRVVGVPRETWCSVLGPD